MACSPGPRAAATADFGNWRVPARLTAWLRSWRSLTWRPIGCPRRRSRPRWRDSDTHRNRAARDLPYERSTSMAIPYPSRLTRKQRRELTRRLRSADPGLDVIHPNAAGIDVGNSAHYVAVRPDRDPDPVRRFECFTADLHQLADWLQHCGVTTVALQSTGVYWLPLYDILDARGLEVYLVNARHTKNLPGRKSDVQESQWLLKLHTYGLLRNSFRPPQEIRTMRTYWRHRNDLIQGAARHIHRMQKALTQMNIQLANVLSDISGKSGQAIIKAILAGERDPHELAALCDCRVKASEEEVAH